MQLRVLPRRFAASRRVNVVGEPAADVPAAALSVGDVVAERYRIDALLGQGGMGVVYRVEHLHLRKPLALKVLLPEWSSMPEVVARFEREAVAASNIQSPHVAAATDFGRLPNGSFFLVMEFVGGCTLRSVLETGALETTRALRIARGIVSGLHAAHSLGIVHRDMKPENVMLLERDGDSDFVKLLDFGIAKVSGFGAGGEGGASGVLTRVGAVIGTPDYMAPEQAMGQAIDARTDLYSVGVILFEMLAGQRPFVGEAVTVIRQHVMADVPDLPSSVTEGADPRVAAIVRRLLAKSVDNRFSDAAELLDAIDGCLQELGLGGQGGFSGAPAQDAIQVTMPGSQGVLRAVGAGIKVATARSLRDALGAVRRTTRGRIIGSAVVAAVVVAMVVALRAVNRTPAPAATTATPATDLAEVTVAPAASLLASSTPAKNDGVPPVAVLPPPPAPSSSSASGAGSAMSASSGEHRATTQRKSRRTGPGGIYIPPPSEWFK